MRNYYSAILVLTCLFFCSFCHGATNNEYDYYPMPSNTQDQGTSTVNTTITWCVNDANGATRSICLNRDKPNNINTFLYTTDGTITSNINLVVMAGAQISVNSGKTLTIEGNIDAGLYPIFTGGGTIRVKRAYPQWWGAKFDSVNNDASAMQSAINSVDAYGSGTVYLSSGSASIGTTSLTLKPRVRIIGEGRGISKIIYSGTSNFALSTGTTETARKFIGLEGFTIDSASSGINLVEAQNGIYRDLEINTNTDGNVTGSIGMQLKAGSWENSISEVVIDGNDEEGKQSTKGIYQLAGNPDKPNINRFSHVYYKNLHYGMFLQDGYDAAAYGARFAKTRYHFYLGANVHRFRSIGSSHESKTTYQKAIPFNQGTMQINPNDMVTQDTATAIVTDVEKEYGTWTSGTAEGWLYVWDYHGSFGTGTISVGTNTVANVDVSIGTLTSHFALARIDQDNEQSNILFPCVLTNDKCNIHDYSGKATYNYRDSWNLKSNRSGLDEPIFNFEQTITPLNDRVVRIRSRSGAANGTKMLQIVKGDTESSLSELAAFYGNGNFVLNNGTAINKYLSATASLNFGTVNANSVATRTLTVTGSLMIDTVFASPNDEVGAGLVWSARVSGTNTVEVRLANPTSSNITSTVRTWRVSVFKH